MPVYDFLEVPSPELDEDALSERFNRLQAKLVPLWRSIEAMGQDTQTIVVVPSLTVDYALQGSEVQAYEERFLFLLLLLRQPQARLIYVTSQAIAPEVVDYYLGLLPGVIASHARDRLFLVAPHDGAPQPLSLKLLQRPHILEKIRALIPDKDRAHLVPFNTTRYERDLALKLGIPMYGADPKHLRFGTKSGCRKLFAEAGLHYPMGFEDLSSMDDLLGALKEVRTQRPDIEQVMVKLNEGVSGEGNAVLDLRGVDASSRDALTERVRSMQLEAPAMGLDTFLAKLADKGGIVEERIAGEVFRSPSAQLRNTPLGKVELLSTHDQLLGGPTGQSFLGAKFPADEGYAGGLASESMKVGRKLAEDGVLGRYAVDFVSAKIKGEWKNFAIEVNLRKGGTTHPFLTLQFLTDGQYDAERGVFETPSGQPKCYVASDHVEAPSYRAFDFDDIFDIAVRHKLHFDQARQTGVVFHMMTALGDRGRVGMTAVGNSHEQAREFYDRTVAVLDDEAAKALSPRPLPDF